LLNSPTPILGSLGFIGNESIFELPSYAMVDEENRGVDQMDYITGVSMLPWGNDILNNSLEDIPHNWTQDQGDDISTCPRKSRIADESLVTAIPLAAGADQLGSYSSSLSAVQNGDSFPTGYDIAPTGCNGFPDQDSFLTENVDYLSLCGSEAMPNIEMHAAWPFVKPTDIRADTTLSSTHGQNLIEQWETPSDIVSHSGYLNLSEAGAAGSDLSINASLCSANLDDPHPLHYAGQTPAAGNSGMELVASWNEIKPCGPVSVLNRPLPKKRRGGRQGPLSEAQKKRRKQAQQDGVCIKCRRNKVQVSNS
jgi:hypothetical protein